MRIIRSISMILLITSFIFACTESSTIVPSETDTNKIKDKEQTDNPPKVPLEFRTLSTKPIPEAVNLLRTILKGGHAEMERKNLAKIYHDAGFYGASHFFENTLRVLHGEEVVLPCPESPIAWSYPMSRVGERSRKIADHIYYDLILDEGKYREAVALARQTIDEEGPSQPIVVEWAYATLWMVIVKREDVSDEALEVAIRLFLTSLEEKVIKPIGADTLTLGYGFLNSLFWYLGDPLSSLTAGLLRIFHAKEENISFNKLGRKDICNGIERPQDILKLPDKWWRENDAYKAMCNEK